MIERTYNVPLRAGFRNTARYKKTKKAVTTLREFLQQHMKSDKILIGRNLNKFLWKDGIKNPPHHVKVTVIKEDDGTVKAELLGFKYEHLTKAEKDKATEKKEKAEKKKEEKKTETKKEDKTETKDESAEETKTEEKPKPKKKTAKKE
jgi:ribosomal protein L31E